MQYYINPNELDNFSYNKVSNTNFFIIVTEIEGLLSSFENDVEYIEIPGRSEDLLIDNKRKKNKEIKVAGYIDIERANKNIDVLADEIQTWLQGTVGYKELTFSNHNKKYRAICINSIEINEIIKDLGEIYIIFSVSPNVEVIA